METKKIQALLNIMSMKKVAEATKTSVPTVRKVRNTGLASAVVMDAISRHLESVMDEIEGSKDE